jgi:hypothetical protein
MTVRTSVWGGVCTAVGLRRGCLHVCSMPVYLKPAADLAKFVLLFVQRTHTIILHRVPRAATVRAGLNFGDLWQLLSTQHEPKRKGRLR